jgi:hypothetical protein
MLDVGDLLFTRTKTLGGRLIRLGAALLDEPNLDNHVAIVHHRDDAGRWWAIEGRPGGAGWVDARQYLDCAYTGNNVLQPKTARQRARVAEVALGMLGVGYDWAAVIDDALMCLHLRDLWLQDWSGAGSPAHVVCSSLAAYLYETVGLARPTEHEARFTTPADWSAFVLSHDYEAPRASLVDPTVPEPRQIDLNAGSSGAGR